MGLHLGLFITMASIFQAYCEQDEKCLEKLNTCAQLEFKKYNKYASYKAEYALSKIALTCIKEQKNQQLSGYAHSNNKRTSN